jgi:MtN3 and saliva related transmembrane protein
MDNVILPLGLIAGTGTTISFFPQLYKIVKTKKTEDLSPVMFVIHTTGVTCWIIYGILINNFIIVLFNSITLLFCFTIIIFMIKERISKNILPITVN